MIVLIECGENFGGSYTVFRGVFDCKDKLKKYLLEMSVSRLTTVVQKKRIEEFLDKKVSKLSKKKWTVISNPESDSYYHLKKIKINEVVY